MSRGVVSRCGVRYGMDPFLRLFLILQQHQK